MSSSPTSPRAEPAQAGAESAREPAGVRDAVLVAEGVGLGVLLPGLVHRTNNLVGVPAQLAAARGALERAELRRLCAGHLERCDRLRRLLDVFMAGDPAPADAGLLAALPDLLLLGRGGRRVPLRLGPLPPRASLAGATLQLLLAALRPAARRLPAGAELRVEFPQSRPRSFDLRYAPRPDCLPFRFPAPPLPRWLAAAAAARRHRFERRGPCLGCRPSAAPERS